MNRINFIDDMLNDDIDEIDDIDDESRCRLGWISLGSWYWSSVCPIIYEASLRKELLEAINVPSWGF